MTKGGIAMKAVCRASNVIIFLFSVGKQRWPYSQGLDWPHPAKCHPDMDLWPSECPAYVAFREHHIGEDRCRPQGLVSPYTNFSTGEKALLSQGSRKNVCDAIKYISHLPFDLVFFKCLFLSSPFGSNAIFESVQMMLAETPKARKGLRFWMGREMHCFFAYWNEWNLHTHQAVSC